METNRLVVQTYGHTLGREETLVRRVAQQRGLPIVEAGAKQMERSRVALQEADLVVGSVGFTRHAMRQLGITLPEHTPYPSALTPWLHRAVRRVPQLGLVQRSLHEGARPLFVKPAADWKRFTGFVAEYADDYRFAGVSRRLPVWVSEPVNFVSEWRAYVANHALRAVKFADHGGNREARPDEGAIAQAVAALAAAGQAPAGYVVDFGVLDTGQTALVELNDGFSFGAYDGLDAEILFDVLNARWRELIAARLPAA